MTRSYRKWDDIWSEMIRENPELERMYVEVAVEDYLKDGDVALLVDALRLVVESQGGIPKLAEKIAMPKQTLYKALSPTGNPRIRTIGAILNGLGYRLRLEPISDSLSRVSA